MGKRRIGIVVLVLLMFVMIGCDEGGSYTYSDILGEWDLPDGTHVSVMQDDTDPSIEWLDISWNEGDYAYFVTVDGTSSGNLFTGAFIERASHSSDSSLDWVEGDDPDHPLSIKVTLTKNKDKPKLVCVGDAPLNGKVFNK